MADKKYKLNFTMTDGSERSVEFTSPQGPQGEKGEQGEGVFAFNFRGNETCPVTAAEVYAAVEAGNVCVAIDNIIGRTYVYHGKAPYNDDESYNVPTFIQPILMGADSVDFNCMQIDPDGIARSFLHTDVRIASPRKIIFTGAVNKTYDGSQDVTIKIPSSTGGSDTAASEDIFVVHFSITDGTADKTQDEIKTAVSDGKVCIALDAGGHVYVYAGNKTSNSDSTLRVPTFVDNANYEDGTLTIEYVQFYSDGTLETFYREASLGGGAADNIFVINMSLANGTYDTTYDEIRAAINAGKMCIAVDSSGHSYTYVGMQKCTGDVMTLAPTFVDPATINDGTLHIGYIQFFSTGVIESFSRDAELSGGGSGLPEPEGPHLQLVTDSDGKVSWQEQLAYENTETVEIIPQTTISEPVDGYHLYTGQLGGEVEVGKAYTVTYNGVDYICEAHQANITGDESNPIYAVILGNTNSGGEDDTGEPFVIIAGPPDVTALYGATVVISHNKIPVPNEITVKIVGESTTRKTVPLELLPEGVGGKENVVILPECEIVQNEASGDGSMLITEKLQAQIVSGNVYSVIWNGQEYNCAAFESAGHVGLGNIGLMAGGADTGEPFIIVIIPEDMVADYGAYGMAMPLDGSTTATLSISGESIQTIPSEYLDLEWKPESIPVGDVVLPWLRSGEDGTVVLGNVIDGLSVGEKLIVFMDNKRYDAIVHDLDGMPYIGNVALAQPSMQDINTGEPFFVSNDSTETSRIYFGQNSGVHTIAIYKDGNSGTHNMPVPKNYLPEIGVFYVNVDIDPDDTSKFKSDKTAEEIYAAYLARRPVMCSLNAHGDPIILQPHIMDSNNPSFCGFWYQTNSVQVYNVTINSIDGVTTKVKTLTTT